MLANLIQPVIVYRDCFSKRVWPYFKDSVKYIGVIVGIVLLMIPVKTFIMTQVNLLTFIIMAAVITLVYNGIFFLLFRRTQEFAYLWNLAAGRLPF